MNIAGVYSFNGGKEVLTSKFESELNEIKSVIMHVDSASCKNKVSKEKTMPGKSLFSPRALNKSFDKEFLSLGWKKHKERCIYPTEFYVSGYTSSAASRGAFREMDFVKNRLGVEVQFGKYAFMVYNVCAKMTIFHKLGVIDVGVEIVPVKDFADDMSTGVSYFEQFVWDLTKRGIADIDIPVLIMGIAA